MNEAGCRPHGNAQLFREPIEEDAERKRHLLAGDSIGQSFEQRGKTRRLKSAESLASGPRFASRAATIPMPEQPFQGRRRHGLHVGCEARPDDGDRHAWRIWRCNLCHCYLAGFAIQHQHPAIHRSTALLGRLRSAHFRSSRKGSLGSSEKPIVIRRRHTAATGSWWPPCLSLAVPTPQPSSCVGVVS